MRTQPDSLEKNENIYDFMSPFFSLKYGYVSEEALNKIQPTLRKRIGMKFMFSLMDSEGIENYLVFDTNLSFSAQRAEFSVPFSRCLSCS